MILNSKYCRNYNLPNKSLFKTCIVFGNSIVIGLMGVMVQGILEYDGSFLWGTDRQEHADFK